MKYRPPESDSESDGKKRPRGDLPVFEAYDPERESQTATQEGPTDFHSLKEYGSRLRQDLGADPTALQEESLAQRRKEKPKEAIDFHTLKAGLEPPPKRYQGRSWTDLLIDVLTPIMIFLMVYSVVFFLLDVRYVFTGRHDFYMRLVAFSFVMGCVAINRLVAREGSEESIMYVLVFAGAIGLYTLSLNAFDVGSVAHTFLDRPWLSTIFNMTVVAVLWWVTNRLTHDCCVDTDPQAGDVGLLRRTARRVQKQVERTEKSPEPIFVRKKKDSSILYNELVPYDPTDPESNKPKVEPKIVEEPTKRLPRRHPGVIIFYFAVPSMIIFSLGLRALQRGEGMVTLGQIYLTLYIIAALSLLMLTSLAGVREYFRARRIHVPSAIGFFWIGLGTIMIAMVMLGAWRIPRPGLPPVLSVSTPREAALWESDRFTPVDIAPTAAQMLEGSRFLDRISYAVLIIFGLFLVYAFLRGLALLAGAMGKRRDYLPAFLMRFFDFLDRVLSKLTSLPALPKGRRRIRVSRDVALCAKYQNPLMGDMRTSDVDTRQVVETTYDALCALAEDLGVPRRKDQTPYEFLQSFPRELRGLKDVAKELTDIYVRSAYSNYKLDPRTHDRLRKFWINYERVRRKILK